MPVFFELESMVPLLRMEALPSGPKLAMKALLKTSEVLTCLPQTMEIPNCHYLDQQVHFDKLESRRPIPLGICPKTFIIQNKVYVPVHKSQHRFAIQQIYQEEFLVRMLQVHDALVACSTLGNQMAI